MAAKSESKNAVSGCTRDIIVRGTHSRGEQLAGRMGDLQRRSVAAWLTSCLNDITPITELVQLVPGVARLTTRERWRWAAAIYLARVALLEGGEIYGGFLRDIHAGFGFSDLDLYFDKARVV